MKSKSKTIRWYLVLVVGATVLALYYLGYSLFGATIEEWFWGFLLLYGTLAGVIIAMLYLGAFIYERVRRKKH
jgi:hypothetical protein